MQCTHSIQSADVGMLQMNKAEAKRYVEENVTKKSTIISSSQSYIIMSYIFQVLHSSRVFLLLNALYTNKTRFFRARSFCVAKSNANRYEITKKGDFSALSFSPNETCRQKPFCELCM